jgi:glycosyltransferase involved in cell wall biosynthesis
MGLMDLSILIPARNEMFLARTIEDILENIEGDTEVIAVCDGEWPEPPIPDHPRVNLIYYGEAIGQRAATNEAARLSQAKFIMKCDAHCAFDKGFDVKLMADCEYDWTVVPRMYNLHVFNWKCKSCSNETYQGPTPVKCEKCEGTEFERVILWQPRWNRKSDFMRFDSNMKFQYWGALEKRPEMQGDIADTMSLLGAAWFIHRKRFWDLDGMDEEHGSWGQMGTEIACKAWLSGGRLVVNKKTWFAHMFRTQGGDFGFPYPLSGKAVGRARKRSKELWQGNTWPKAVHKLDWLLDHFKPVPDWHDIGEKKPTDRVLTKGLVYYTDNRCEERIMIVCRNQLKKCCPGFEIISVSQYPIDFGKNIVMNLPRSSVSMYRQILAGLQASTVDIVYLIEHDVLYHPSHFDFVPLQKHRIYYNLNRWAVSAEDGQALHYISWCNSFVVAYRKVLLRFLTEFIDLIEKVGYSRRRMGHAIGKRKFEGVVHYSVDTFRSEHPCVDIRHSNNFTRNRFSRDQFPRRGIEEWELADEVPFWGRTKGRFDDFLKGVK